ncbi:protein ASPARTIC PROTEASE IN GUARD CELL 2 [Panicum miliaceum]|uniref:Protein ASPARTIC PROTEASE IN GUARD CELL 2 n=1 Tax=Panicum miliaceum TaxID=4540 RepID=A0A3L6TDB2_PANMI|nr:protein ASPARTIC PROTEASE IN GUARD CELL 2 [Panicum miliaceum]
MGMRMLPVLLLVLAAGATASHSSSSSSCPATPPDSGATLQVSHAFGPCSPLGPEAASPSRAGFLADQAARDASRLLYLDSLAVRGRAYAPIASGRQLLQTPTYVVRARLGTPAQQLLLAVDTSNDAAWIPCAGCAGCPTSTPFNPAASTSYGPVPCGSPLCAQAPNAACPLNSKACGFSLTYADSSLVAALSQDSLAVANDVVKAYTFGCLQRATGTAAPPQGLLGLGRGPLSFLSQTKDMYEATFSYCLPSFKSLNFSGTLRLGRKGQPQRIKTTPLLANPHRSSLYYVNMTGIRVGRKVVPIPAAALAFDPATGAGTVLDSGTMFTRLVAPAYVAVRDEVRRRVGAPVSSLGGFDTCFNDPAVKWPAVTLLFDGMQVTLPEENVVIHSTYGTTSCLAMAAAPDGVNTVLNVIASMQQQNHRVLFDVPNGRVGFARERCTAA